MKVRIKTRPGHPGTDMVTKFICSEGHTVIEGNSREKVYISDEEDTVECEECGIEFTVATKKTLVPKRVSID